MEKMKDTKNSVKKAPSFEEIQQAIFNKLRELELPLFSSREMAARLQRLGVLPTDQFYNLDGVEVIFVKAASAKYIIRRPMSVDFFGKARLEILD